MPIIPISDKYRLASDARSWELQERSQRKHRQTKAPMETWEAIRWYSTLEFALRDVAEFRLRTADTTDISIAMQEVKKLMAGVSDALATLSQQSPIKKTGELAEVSKP